MWSSLLMVLVSLGAAILAVMLAERRIVTQPDDSGGGLARFATDVSYEEFPQHETLDDNTRYSCGVQDLRECRMGDASYLFGCRELGVRCVHFDKDTRVYDENAAAWNMPANRSPDHGYVLPITDLAAECNVWHGDWTIVAAEAGVYSLLCECKNPGYVGKDDPMGNCTKVRICHGGRVARVDVPLHEMECVCEPTETMERESGDLAAPYCRDLTVAEANERFDDWTSLVTYDDRLDYLPTKHFAPEIARQMRAQRLVDPCKRSLLNTRVRVKNGRFDQRMGSCRLHSYGLPVRNGLLKRVPLERPATYVVGNWLVINGKPDVPSSGFDSAINTDEWVEYRMSDQIPNPDNSGRIVRRFAAITVSAKLSPAEGPDPPARAFKLPDNIGFGGRFGELTMLQSNLVISGRCNTARLFSYDCNFKLTKETYYQLGVQLARPHPKPSILIGPRSAEWDFVERSVYEAVDVLDGGITLDHPRLNLNGKWWTYGIRIAHSNQIGRRYSSPLAFIDWSDYQVHRQAVLF